MANNYLQFSEVIPRLTADEEHWLAEQLEVVHIHNGKEYTEHDLPKELAAEDIQWSGCRAYLDLDGFDPEMEDGAGFCYKFDTDNDASCNWGRHLWVYAEEYGDVDRLAHLVQKFLKRFRPQDSWSLGYACTCSKPRVGEFSGGAVHVTADKIAWENAADFIALQYRIFKYVQQALGGAAKKTRPIEMYVGVRHGDAGAWHTTTVEIPCDTPADAIPAVAAAVLEKQLADSEEPVVFSGVYCTLDDEIPKSKEESLGVPATEENP